MNNYSNMFYNPNDYFYQNEIANNQISKYQNQQKLPINNYKNTITPNQNLISKLKKQAGDNMKFNTTYNQTLNTNNIYDAYNGFIRGNMFPELYNQYKISKPYEIRPENKQAEILTYIDAYCFAAHELNLYLDNNPNDRNAINLFKEITNQKEQLLNEYQNTYGPIFVDKSTTYPWSWNESPWPWEN